MRRQFVGFISPPPSTRPRPPHTCAVPCSCATVHMRAHRRLNTLMGAHKKQILCGFGGHIACAHIPKRSEIIRAPMWVFMFYTRTHQCFWSVTNEKAQRERDRKRQMQRSRWERIADVVHFNTDENKCTGLPATATALLGCSCGCCCCCCRVRRTDTHKKGWKRGFIIVRQNVKSSSVRYFICIYVHKTHS